MKNNKLRLLHMPVLRALCAAIFVFASTNLALAQDWRFEPIFKVGVEYDDNSRLDPRTDQELDLSGLLLDARADIYYSSPASRFFLQPTVRSRNYNDDSVADSNDFFLRSDFRRRMKLSTVGFRAKFDKQTIRTGERADSDLEIEDPDEFTNDDTGRVFLAGDRMKLRLAPYWEYQLSNASSIGADIDYFDTQYDDVFAGILGDYTDMQLNLNYGRSVSDVTTWGVVLSGRRYDSDNAPEAIDGFALLGELEHRLSEKTKVRALIGLEDTDTPGFETDPEVVGSVTLSRQLETIRFFAQYRRSVNGGGGGTLTLRDSFNLNFRRRLNERISAGLGVRAYQTDSQGNASLIEDRRYVQLQSSFVWYFSTSLVIEADYRYTIIDRGEALGGAANSNRLNLWFVYQPRTIPKI
jgi:hypothetical protein